MIPRSLVSFIWRWTRSLRRPSRAIAECQRDLARLRSAHKPTRAAIDRMRKARHDGLRRDVAAMRGKTGVEA